MLSIKRLIKQHGILFVLCFLSATINSYGQGCPQATIRVQIFTDDYPEETRWELRNANNILVASDDLDGLLDGTLYFWDICVPNSSCYSFTIFDSFGDGICCGQGSGFYSILVNGNQVATGGAFIFSETVNNICSPAAAGGGCTTSCNGGPAPVNDDCFGSNNLGALIIPNSCFALINPGLGTPQNFNGTTLCANAEFPYTYQPGCQTGNDMAFPAADVWFRFTITGSVLDANITSNMSGVSIGLYQDGGGGCGNLLGRGCAEDAFSGSLSATFTTLSPGTYFLQVSGSDTLDQCTFALTLTNNDDCDACVLGHNMTATPPPVNGRYRSGTTVRFCYTVDNYNQTAINWLHGIVPQFGSGWDMSTLTGFASPSSCDGAGSWSWYPNPVTGISPFGVTSVGPGFFYESSMGCPTDIFGFPDCDPTDPGDNYGDNNPNNLCDWTFCWTISTKASCPPGQQGEDLSIEIHNYGDSETGSWNQSGCTTDPNYQFFAVLFCCDSMTLTVNNVTCNGGTDGSCTVQGGGQSPWDYELQNNLGATLGIQSNDSNSHTFANLPAGDYIMVSTDDNFCSDARQFRIGQPDSIAISGLVVNVGCSGETTGSVDVSVSGGVFPYTYLWSPGGQTTQDLTGLSAGTYTVTVTDSDSCSNSRSFTVTEPSPLAGLILTNDASCSGGNDGSASAVVSGGTQPYNYLWDRGTPVGNGSAVINLSAGLVTVIISDANGCLRTLIAQINEPQFIPVTSVSVSICQGDSIFVGGGFQTTPGIYFDTLITSIGCDSVVETTLNIFSTSLTELAVDICDGDSVFAGGAFQTTAGIYFDTFAGSNGCDSVVQTTVGILPSVFISTSAQICDGDSFFAGGSFQTQPGLYYDTIITAFGCDSIIETELIVLQSFITNVSAEICDGDSYFAGGANQTVSGTYFDTIVIASGCDSIIITELIVNPNPVASIIADQVCLGQATHLTNFSTGVDAGATYYVDFLSDGSFEIVAPAFLFPADTFIVIPVAGVLPFTVIVVNSTGCSDTLNSFIVINSPAPITTIQVSICDGDSYFVGGGSQTQPGFYVDTLTGFNGCDSIITTELIVLPLSNGTVQVSICDGDSYFVGGGNQTQPGFYVDTLTGFNGCDSILTTELIVLPVSNGTIQVSICDGDSYFVGGSNQTQAGFYVDTLTGSNSCDSILTTELIVLPNSGFLQSFDVCDGDGVFAGGAFQSTSGTYFDTLAAANGCDSVITTNLNVGAPLTVDFDVRNISCGCDTVQNGGGGQPPVSTQCELDISGFVHGTIITNQLASDGVTITGDSYNSAQRPDTIAIFNSNVTGSLDPDLEVGIGNLLILPENLTDINGNGLIDNPSDASVGGVMIFTFDRDRTVYSITLVDNDRNDGTIRAYDQNNTLLLSVTTPSGAASSIQVYNLNIAGVRRLEVDYRDSRGVTDLILDCPSPPSCGLLDVSAQVHGEIVTNQFDSQGVTVTGTSNNSAQYPNAVAIFNSNLTNTTHDDLEVGIGNLFVLPLNLTDNNNDGVIDNLRDSPVGGTIAFTFDRDRTVVSITLADNDYNGTIIRIYDSNNNVLLTLPVPPPNLPAGTLHYEVIPLNVSGARKITVSYTRKLGVTGLILDCPPQPSSCGLLDVSAQVHGEIVTNQFDSQGVTVTGTSNNSAQYPNAVAIFNSNLTNTNHNDLEVGIGNLFVLPLDLTDNNNDGVIDNLKDSPVGGTIAFTFDRDRTVVSITLADNDYNGTIIRIYDSNNNVLLTLPVPPPNLPAGTLHYEVIPLNVSGARKVTVSYPHKLGVAGLILDCPSVSCCDGNATANVSGGFPPYQYAWSTGSISDYSGDSLCLGTYYVTITDQLGCSTVDSFTIIQSDANYTDTTAAICEGDSVFAGGAFQTESGTYYDTLGITDGCLDILVTELTVTTSFNETVQVEICEGQSYLAGGALQTESGTYIDVFTAAGGCDSIVTTELTVSSSLTFNSQVSICDGDSYFAGGALQTEAGIYTDTFTSSGGCDSIVITDLFVSLINITQQTQVNASCFGAADGVIEIIVNGGVELYDLTWSDGTVTQGIGESVLTGLSGLSSGQYSVTVTDNIGCSASANFTVTEPNQLALGASTTPASCAGFSDGAIDLVVLGGTPFYTYSWSSGETTEDITGIEAGTYTVIVTDANGCSATLIVLVSESGALTINVQAQICAGESYFAGGALQTEAGTYTDTFTASAGCDSIVITDLTVLPASNSSVDLQICQGDSVFAGGAFQTTSGTYFDTITTSNGCDSIVTTNLSVLSELLTLIQADICEGESYLAGGSLQTTSGTYFDTLTASSGCDSVIVTDLIVSPQINLSFSVDSVSCFGASDGDIDLSVSGGTAPFIYSWSNGQTTEDVTGLTAGQQSVTVTDAIGCSATANALVGQPQPLALGATTIPAGCFGASDGSINLLVLGGTSPYTYLWSNSETTDTISGLPAGQYSVQVTDNNGCVANVIVIVPEPDEMILTATVTNESLGNDGAVDLSVSGGASPYGYSWSDGSTTEDISNLTAGSYTVTVTDDNGCTAVETFTVTFQPPRLGSKPKIFNKDVDVLAYPVPFNDFLIIEHHSLSKGEATASVRDILGRIVKQERLTLQKGNNRHVLKMDSGLLNGIYMLELETTDQTKTVKVIMK